MRKQTGFSLVEISIVLVIVGLLLGSLLNGVTGYLRSSQISTTKKALDGIERAITGFVISNGRFPCPDKLDDDGNGVEDMDGVEDFNAGTCDVQYGFLPHVTLGVEKEDGWGGAYMYGVDPNYSDAPPPSCGVTFRLDSPDGEELDVEVDDGTVTNTVAIAYSLGLDNSTQQQPDPDNLKFADKKYVAPGSPESFDDMVLRISSLTIKADMLQARSLPEDPAICP